MSDSDPEGNLSPEIKQIKKEKKRKKRKLEKQQQKEAQKQEKDKKPQKQVPVLTPAPEKPKQKAPESK